LPDRAAFDARVAEIERLIRDAGRVPAERDSLYDLVNPSGGSP